MRQPLFFALILVLSSASLDQIPEDKSNAQEPICKLLTENEVAIAHTKIPKISEPTLVFIVWKLRKNWDPNLTHWLLCHHLLALMNVGLCFTSDVNTFDQNWHHLYWSSAGLKDLSNDTQVTLISWQWSLTNISMKMLRNLSEKLAAKFPAASLTVATPW